MMGDRIQIAARAARLILGLSVAMATACSDPSEEERLLDRLTRGCVSPDECARDCASALDCVRFDTERIISFEELAQAATLRPGAPVDGTLKVDGEMHLFQVAPEEPAQALRYRLQVSAQAHAELMVRILVADEPVPIRRKSGPTDLHGSTIELTWKPQDAKLYGVVIQRLFASRDVPYQLQTSFRPAPGVETSTD